MGSADVQGPLWGAEAGTWSKIQEPHHEPLFEAMLEATGVGPGKRVLDVGCGGGFSSRLAVERGAQVTGLDAAEGMIDHARAAVPHAEFHVGEMEKMPFEDRSFDVVFAGNAVQYAADLVAALREFGRVCKPGGLIAAGLFGPPEKVAFKAVFSALQQVSPPPPPGAKPGGPFALSEPGLLAGKFEEAGLRVAASGEADCPFHYPSFEEFYLGAVRAPGPGQRILQLVDEQTLRSTVAVAARPFTAADGSVTIRPNVFIYVVGTA